MTSLRLALEEWADEAAAPTSEDRANVRSAIRKLASMTPSALAGYRLNALEERDHRRGRGHEWGWPTAASATIPLMLGLTFTLVTHLIQVIEMAGAG